MGNVKKSSIEGTFYPSKKEDIIDLIKKFEYNITPPKYLSRAVIAPHAGYIYSLNLILSALSHLKNCENIFIIAPAHKYYVQKAFIADYDRFLNPLGEIPVNTKILKELNQKFEIEYQNDAFLEEHSIEVMLPALKYLKKESNFKIIPILSGLEGVDLIKNIISYYYKDEKNAFIISSDLSHFYTFEEAKIIDENTAQLIEEGRIGGISPKRACGNIGINALINFSKENNHSLIRIKMSNSYLVNKDPKSTVGYGSWFLYEGEKNAFIKKYYTDFILNISKNAIISKGKYRPPEIDGVFLEKGASFVTLEKEGFLRGCIGSIVSGEPLIDNILRNAYNSAYRDYRFPALDEAEFDKIKIKVSILSSIKKIDFSDENDLLDKIVPDKDGIIIKEGNYQAVYLPSVWDELKDKKLFLNSLKQKAGLPSEYFSNTFEAYRFYTEYIE